MITYSNKAELTAAVSSLLRQRMKWYQMARQTHHANLCWNLLARFDLISKWGYWRHCLEVANQEALFYKILPSADGEHAVIREQALAMITHCKSISSIPYSEYVAQTTGGLMPISA